jgi:adenine-specific DNA-methyltransferase
MLISAPSSPIISEPSFTNLSRDSKTSQKLLGQFMTPSKVAKYMAEEVVTFQNNRVVRILEPSAGMGILLSSVVYQLINRANKPNRIEVVVYELDPRMFEILVSLTQELATAASGHAVEFECSVKIEDFLLANIAGKFDIIIANPPFFKIRKDDPRALNHAYAVHGQPNIYGLFMAACADLMSNDSVLCFLTPRSWTSGTYFARVREHILNSLEIYLIHLFDGRKSTFKDDEVQQEMMITWARPKGGDQEKVLLSTSRGINDLSSASRRSISLIDVFTDASTCAISLPLSGITTNLEQFSDTISSAGLRASTGKVVPFRAKKSILTRSSKNSVPLLWMQHVKPYVVTWPIVSKKQHIRADEKSRKLLIPNDNYVLIRRFSPRDGENWVTAAPLFKLAGISFIGIENHVNYIRRVNGHLTRNETAGLAAYLSSTIVKNYLSARMGHTQINASHLNNLPLPPMPMIAEIGSNLLSGQGLLGTDTVIARLISASTPKIGKDE